jgi:hypothetical protein
VPQEVWLRREWLWKQRAAMPAALWSARTVSSMTRAAGRSYSSTRAACRRSLASFMVRDRSSVQSTLRHCQPACCATWSASWMGLASIAFDPSPIVSSLGVAGEFWAESVLRLGNRQDRSPPHELNFKSGAIAPAALARRRGAEGPRRRQENARKNPATNEPPHA